MPIENKHHLVPRSKGGSNHMDNIRVMDMIKHEALHVLFGTKLPHEQFSVLFRINGTTFTEQYSDMVRNILEVSDPDYVYKRGILRPKL